MSGKRKKLSLRRETVRNLQSRQQSFVPLKSPNLKDLEGGSLSTTLTLFCTPVCTTPAYPTVTPTIRRISVSIIDSIRDSCLGCSEPSDTVGDLTVRDTESRDIWTPPTNCFTGDTLVRVPEGLKRMDGIEAGDQIFAWNQESGAIEVSTVLELLEHEGDYEILPLQTDGGEEIQVTANHAFLTSKGWIYSGEMEENSVILDLQGKWRQITGTRSPRQKADRVFNIRVKNQRNYFVGKEGLLAREF